MASDTAGASDIAVIQAQFDMISSDQAKVAQAVADLKGDMVSIILRLQCHSHPPGLSVGLAESAPGAAAECQDRLDIGEPADGASGSQPAAAAVPLGRGQAVAVAAHGSHRANLFAASGAEVAIDFALAGELPVGARRSSTANSLDKRRPSERKVARFKRLIRFNAEGYEEEEEDDSAILRTPSERLRSYMRNDADRLERRLDATFAVVIMVNAAFMALDMDLDTGPGRRAVVWTSLSLAFSLLFWAELACRLALRGWRRHFAGRDWHLNALDLALVLVDTAQVACALCLGEKSVEGVPAASLFRLFRIFRIARIVRLLDSPVFKDLLTIVNSLRSGLVTLGWSFVPFFLVLYTACLVCRETFGRGDEENVGQYFDTVPRALLTMFRCGFGDFSSRTGVPIIEYVMASHGLFWGFFYGVFVFFISVGVFNVIAAVFLESTLAATADTQKRKLQGRLADKKLWYTRAFTIVKHLLPYTSCAGADDADIAASSEKIMAAEVKRRDIPDALKSEEAASALRDLDIDEADHHILGDILDHNHSGSITILEFISGLKRLRGNDLRRSDVLSVDLMVRALQEKVDEMFSLLRSLEERGSRGMHVSTVML